MIFFIGAGKRTALGEGIGYGESDYVMYVNIDHVFAVRRIGSSLIEWVLPDSQFVEEPYSVQRWREIIAALNPSEE
jgi:hypothetical protein